MDVYHMKWHSKRYNVCSMLDESTDYDVDRAFKDYLIPTISECYRS